jgi:hypothetical protein
MKGPINMATVTGRPKKDSRALRNSGARAGRIKAREAEERTARDPAHRLAVDRFIDGISRERKSFQARRIDSETLVKDHEGKYESDFLTQTNAFAERITTTESFACPQARRLAARYLSDLKHGHGWGIHFDVQAVSNLELWFDAFAVEGSEYSDSDVFAMANFVGWKTRAGDPRFCKSWSRLSARQHTVLTKGLKVLAATEI